MLAYFGNLPSSLSTPTLQSLLSLCGLVRSLKRPTDSFALIEFAEASAARLAKLLFCGLSIEGKEISVKVEEAGSTDATEEGEIKDDSDEQESLMISAKRREIERILQQKRIYYEFVSVRSNRGTSSDRGTSSSITPSNAASSSATSSKASSNAHANAPANNQDSLHSSLKRLERDFRDAVQRDAERSSRHAHEIALLRTELATSTPSPAPPISTGDLSTEFDSCQTRFDAQLFVKEKEIFRAILKGRQERLAQLPCTLTELLPLRSPEQVPDESTNTKFAHLLVARAACRKLQLPERIASLALAALREANPLEQLCSEPAFLMAAKGPVEGECLLSCVLRAQQIFE